MYKIHVYIYIFILYNHPYIQYIHKDCTHTLYTHSHPQHYLTSMISQHLYFCLVVEKEAEKCLWCTAKASKQGNKVTFKTATWLRKTTHDPTNVRPPNFEIRGFHIQTVSSIKSRTPQQNQRELESKRIHLSFTYKGVGGDPGRSKVREGGAGKITGCRFCFAKRLSHKFTDQKKKSLIFTLQVLVSHYQHVNTWSHLGEVQSKSRKPPGNKSSDISSL